MEPVLQELSHLSSRAAAAEIERRGLGKLSYKTVARARVRLGLGIDQTEKDLVPTRPDAMFSQVGPSKRRTKCVK